MTRQIPLSELTPGTSAVIRSLLSEGTLRRRLITAGFLENTPVRCVVRSPLGEPAAYLIRDTVVALRRREAETILVGPSGQDPLSGTDSTSREREPLLVLAGNPNVGKSTVFNALTGLKQHTGNWAGKTVECAQGFCRIENRRCRVVDLPGCYSLLSSSAEENAARTFLLSHVPDAVIAVCDATRLESTLPLALQLLEMGLPVLLCVNLMDEAQRRGKSPDLSLLSERLSIPVIGTSANRRDGLGGLRQALAALLTADRTSPAPSFQIPYPADLETAHSLLAPAVHRARLEKGVSLFPGERFLCLQLLEAFLPASSGTPRRLSEKKRKLHPKQNTSFPTAVSVRQPPPAPPSLRPAASAATSFRNTGTPPAGWRCRNFARDFIRRLPKQETGSPGWTAFLPENGPPFRSCFSFCFSCSGSPSGVPMFLPPCFLPPFREWKPFCRASFCQPAVRPLLRTCL